VTRAVGYAEQGQAYAPAHRTKGPSCAVVPSRQRVLDGSLIPCSRGGVCDGVAGVGWGLAEVRAEFVTWVYDRVYKRCQVSITYAYKAQRSSRCVWMMGSDSISPCKGGERRTKR